MSKLRAVTPDERAHKKMTVIEAADHGTHQDLLRALRDRIAVAIEDPNAHPRDIAVLSLRLAVVSQSYRLAPTMALRATLWLRLLLLPTRLGAGSSRAMAWRGPRTVKDPLLSSPTYRRNRAILKAMRLPCAVCGRTIDYQTPHQFVAGHVVSRRKAKMLGWTEQMINSLTNLRPECRSCSNKTGAREGQQAQRVKAKRISQAKIIYGLDDSARW